MYGKFNKADTEGSFTLTTKDLIGYKDNISNPNFNPKTDHP